MISSIALFVLKVLQVNVADPHIQFVPPTGAGHRVRKYEKDASAHGWLYSWEYS
jgi:hypothetical protein